MVLKAAAYHILRSNPTTLEIGYNRIWVKADEAHEPEAHILYNDVNMREFSISIYTSIFFKIWKKEE